ncbi:MAG: hypothetical protein V3U51_00140 [Thermoplasmata archaeon]
MGATVKCHKEGKLVVVDIKNWNNDAMLPRRAEILTWARDAGDSLDFLAEDVLVENPDSHRFYVPKSAFIDFWKFLYAYEQPTDSDLTELEKWLRKSGTQGSVRG